MEFNLISLFGFIIMAVIMVPNIIYAVRVHGVENKCVSKTMNLLEQAGRYGSMALMVLPMGVWEFGFPSVTELLIYLIGNGALLAAYLVVWGLYFRKRTMWAAIANAVIPTCIFLLSGITLRHWLLVASSVLFGLGHIYVTYQNHK